ncbi:MAG TPA: hypothetical protein VGD52_03195 [Pseudoduganella sp.]
MSQQQALRRRDSMTASRVDCAIALQALAGMPEALRYLRNCGVSPEVIDRVLSSTIARRQRGVPSVDGRA